MIFGLVLHGVIHHPGFHALPQPSRWQPPSGINHQLIHVSARAPHSRVIVLPSSPRVLVGMRMCAHCRTLVRILGTSSPRPYTNLLYIPILGLNLGWHTDPIIYTRAFMMWAFKASYIFALLCLFSSWPLVLEELFCVGAMHSYLAFTRIY
jgi:hypothetical protein